LRAVNHPYLATVTKALEATGESLNPWLTGHRLRYAETLAQLHKYTGPRNAVLELGFTRIFQFLLATGLEFKSCFGSEFKAKDTDAKSRELTVTVGERRSVSKIIPVNLEDEPIPLPDESLDLVVCCEVIEHMDVDPMYLMAEINRVLRPGGQLLMTTPNSASARIVWKILHGHRPHFYMLYSKNRDPYRHNFEYDVHALKILTTASGLECLSMETIDTFEDPVPDALQLLKRSGFPTTHRGDNIFYWGKKISGVIDRWPSGIYG